MKKRAFLGLSVAMLLTLSLLVSSCASSGGSSGGSSGVGAVSNGVPKTLIITGIDNYSGDVLVTLSSTSSPAASMVAVQESTISGNSVTFPLVNPGAEDTRWTGTGDFFVIIIFEDHDNTRYFYSAGGGSPLRYTVSEATTTIPLNQFRLWQ